MAARQHIGGVCDGNNPHLGCHSDDVNDEVVLDSTIDVVLVNLSKSRSVVETFYGLISPQKRRILDFILGSALQFSNYGKLMILSLLKGIGNAIMHTKVEPMLSHFMKQHYDERDKSCQKFSNIETRIMCLLLESCVMSSPSGGDYLKYPLLKALQLDAITSDDPAYVEALMRIDQQKMSYASNGGISTHAGEGGESSPIG